MSPMALGVQDSHRAGTREGVGAASRRARVLCAPGSLTIKYFSDSKCKKPVQAKVIAGDPHRFTFRHGTAFNSMFARLVGNIDARPHHSIRRAPIRCRKQYEYNLAL